MHRTRGKTHNNSKAPPSQASGEDEFAIDENNQRRARRVSARMKKDESSDLEVVALNSKQKDGQARNQREGGDSK